MSNPTEEEINRVIAKRMDVLDIWKHPVTLGEERHVNYTKSLDALIPVVEKISKDFHLYVELFWSEGLCCVSLCNSIGIPIGRGKSKSSSLALSTACYKVLIKELP